MIAQPYLGAFPDGGMAATGSQFGMAHATLPPDVDIEPWCQNVTTCPGLQQCLSPPVVPLAPRDAVADLTDPAATQFCSFTTAMAEASTLRVRYWAHELRDMLEQSQAMWSTSQTRTTGGPLFEMPALLCAYGPQRREALYAEDERMSGAIVARACSNLPQILPNGADLELASFMQTAVPRDGATQEEAVVEAAPSSPTSGFSIAGMLAVDEANKYYEAGPSCSATSGDLMMAAAGRPWISATGDGHASADGSPDTCHPTSNQSDPDVPDPGQGQAASSSSSHLPCIPESPGTAGAGRSTSSSDMLYPGGVVPYDISGVMPRPASSTVPDDDATETDLFNYEVRLRFDDFDEGSGYISVMDAAALCRSLGIWIPTSTMMARATVHARRAHTFPRFQLSFHDVLCLIDEHVPLTDNRRLAEAAHDPEEAFFLQVLSDYAYDLLVDPPASPPASVEPANAPST